MLILPKKYVFTICVFKVSYIFHFNFYLMFILLSNILCQINTRIWMNCLGHVNVLNLILSFQLSNSLHSVSPVKAEYYSDFYFSSDFHFASRVRFDVNGGD